jgi:signal transduction histidine kinase
MSHELRTPLNAIIGFSDIIEGEMFGPVTVPKYLEYITDIKQSGVHLLEVSTTCSTSQRSNPVRSPSIASPWI